MSAAKDVSERSGFRNADAKTTITLVATLDGYRTLTQELRPVEGETKDLVLRLERIPELPLGGQIPAAPPLAVAPFGEAEAKRHQADWASYLKAPVEITNSIGMKLVLIPPGEFVMGDPDAGKDHRAVLHPVQLTQPFYLGMYELTQAEYQAVMKTNPSEYRGDLTSPVEQVSWPDAAEFCRQLSALPDEQAGGRVYRLPSEAEWEYACRAGTTTRFCSGDTEESLTDYAWLGAKFGGVLHPHPVGQKRPNSFGLHDMHGNVWEWCNDWEAPYPAKLCMDPRGPEIGQKRTLRGGCFFLTARGSGSRNQESPQWLLNNLGFRVVCDLPSVAGGPVAGRPLAAVALPYPARATGRRGGRLHFDRHAAVQSDRNPCW